jgi:hypothetical protein
MVIRGIGNGIGYALTRTLPKPTPEQRDILAKWDRTIP